VFCFVLKLVDNLWTFFLIRKTWFRLQGRPVCFSVICLKTITFSLHVDEQTVFLIAFFVFFGVNKEDMVDLLGN